MSDSFVPLMPPKAGAAAEPGFSVMPDGVPASSPAPANVTLPSAPADSCGKPVITLQRNGDVITSIRIQCECGKIIDLNCSY